MKVLISVPTIPFGQVAGELTDYLINIITYYNYRDPLRRFDVMYDRPEGKPVDSCRNMAVKKFLESDAEYMWMIDSDTIPPQGVDTLGALMSHKKKIVGAIVFSFQYNEPFAVVVDINKEGGYIQSPQLKNNKRLISVAATGAACLLVHREVLERMQKKWFETQFREDGILSEGHDFFWCSKARKLGYDIYIDKSIICSHRPPSGIDIKNINDLLVKQNNIKFQHDDPFWA